MIIKSFTAETAATALKKVKEGLGSDAIVLKTTRIPGPGTSTLVEITACLEKPSVGQASIALKTGTVDTVQLPTDEPSVGNSHSEGTVLSPASAFDNEVVLPDDRLTQLEIKLDRLLSRTVIARSSQQYDKTLEPIVELLKTADIPDDFTSELLENESLTSQQDGALLQVVRELLVNRFASMMEHSFTLKNSDKVVFIGPPGSGKSSVMGKLATQLVVKEKKKVTLAGIEFQKVGAHDELSGYAELLDVPVIENLLDSKKVKAIQLIDCPSLPKDKKTSEKLVSAIEKVQTDYRIAVFSSLMNLDDISIASEHLAKLHPTHVVVTMCDLTKRRGAIITAINACKAKLLFLSDSIGGTGKLKTPDPDYLAREILNMEHSREQN